MILARESRKPIGFLRLEDVVFHRAGERLGVLGPDHLLVLPAAHYAKRAAERIEVGFAEQADGAQLAPQIMRALRLRAPCQDPDVAADHRFAVVGRPGGELVDRLGLRRLVVLDLDRFVDGEISVAAARPDLQRAVHSRYARGLVIDDQNGWDVMIVFG